MKRKMLWVAIGVLFSGSVPAAELASSAKNEARLESQFAAGSSANVSDTAHAVGAATRTRSRGVVDAAIAETRAGVDDTLSERLEAGLGTTVEIEIGDAVEADVEGEVAATVATEVVLAVEAEVESALESTLDSEIAAEIEHAVVSEIDAAVEQEIESSLETDVETSILGSLAGL